MMIIVYATSFTSQNTFKSALEEIIIKQTLVIPCSGSIFVGLSSLVY